MMSKLQFLVIVATVVLFSYFRIMAVLCNRER